MPYRLVSLTLHISTVWILESALGRFQINILGHHGWPSLKDACFESLLYTARWKGWKWKEGVWNETSHLISDMFFLVFYSLSWTLNLGQLRITVWRHLILLAIINVSNPLIFWWCKQKIGLKTAFLLPRFSRMAEIDSDYLGYLCSPIFRYSMVLST